MKDAAIGLVGDSGYIPDYCLPGARATDGAGNEYVIVDLTATFYSGDHGADFAGRALHGCPAHYWCPWLRRRHSWRMAPRISGCGRMIRGLQLPCQARCRQFSLHVYGSLSAGLVRVLAFRGSARAVTTSLAARPVTHGQSTGMWPVSAATTASTSRHVGDGPTASPSGWSTRSSMRRRQLVMIDLMPALEAPSAIIAGRVTRTGRKIALCGSHSASLTDAPWTDPSWEFWGHASSRAWYSAANGSLLRPSRSGVLDARREEGRTPTQVARGQYGSDLHAGHVSTKCRRRSSTRRGESCWSLQTLAGTSPIMRPG